MNIAFYSPGWPFGQNGIISYVRTVSLALHDLGHKIVILTPKATGNLGFEQVESISEPRPWRRALRKLSRMCGVKSQANDFALAIAERLARVHARERIDVLEMEESFGWSGVIARNCDVPVVVRLHGPHFLNGPYEVGGPDLDHARLQAEGVAIKHAAAVTAPSRNILDATLAYYSLKRDCHVIPNPVPLTGETQHWRPEDSDPETLLFVGRTDARKGGDLILRAFAELASRRSDLRLHFVGPDQGFADADRRVTFSEFVGRFGPAIANRIIYHGPLAPADIVRLRLTARVTVVCSRFENFPMVCLEALALGCPLVASNVGGIPEIVRHGDTGLLAEPTVTDIADKIARLLDDEALCVSLGAAGRAMCKDGFLPMQVALGLMDVYDQVRKK